MQPPLGAYYADVDAAVDGRLDGKGRREADHEVRGRVRVAAAGPPVDRARLRRRVYGGRVSVGTDRYRPDERHEPRDSDGDDAVAARERAVHRTLRMHRLVSAATQTATYS